VNDEERELKSDLKSKDSIFAFLAVTLERSEEVKKTLESAVGDIEKLAVVSRIGRERESPIAGCDKLKEEFESCCRHSSSNLQQQMSKQNSSRGCGQCLPPTLEPI